MLQGCRRRFCQARRIYVHHHVSKPGSVCLAFPLMRGMLWSRTVPCGGLKSRSAVLLCCVCQCCLSGLRLSCITSCTTTSAVHLLRHVCCSDLYRRRYRPTPTVAAKPLAAADLVWCDGSPSACCMCNGLMAVQHNCAAEQHGAAHAPHDLLQRKHVVMWPTRAASAVPYLYSCWGVPLGWASVGGLVQGHGWCVSRSHRFVLGFCVCTAV